MSYYRISVALVVVCLLMFSATLAVAKGVPPGQAKKQNATVQSSDTASTPPGWQHGKKTGWRGGKYPPGWLKWDKNKQTIWISDRDHAYDEIYRLGTIYKIPAPKQNEISQAFSEAVAGGLIINDAKDKLIGALKNEDSRKGLMIDTTQSVLDLLR